MNPTAQIQQNNVISQLRHRIQSIEMGKVVVKAVELVYPNDFIFKATDGNTYFIDAAWSEVVEALYGDYPYHDNRILTDDLLEWINSNPKRWELDTE